MLYDIQHIGLNLSAETAFQYIAEAKNLPAWTNAFTAVSDDGKAVLMTPQGKVEIGLKVISDAQSGTVDWLMTFPDGSEGIANSRVTPLPDNNSVYSFVLTPPPAPLEQLEGALKQQSAILASELKELKKILEK